MVFEIKTKLSSCEIVRDGEIIGKITFNAHDAKCRAAFFDLYNKIVSAPLTAFSSALDANGVPMAYANAAKAAAKEFNALAKAIDVIFGAGTTSLLVGADNNPALLLEFLAFVSREFRIASGIKIDKYLSDGGSEVME